MRRIKWKCKACGKTSYGSQAGAQHQLRAYQKLCRAYPCPYGNGWHTTSQEARSC